MITYTIDIKSEHVSRMLNREAAVAPSKAAAITQRNGNRMIQMVRALSPFRTGEYRASHQIELTSTGKVFLAEVYTDLPRGRMLEFGGDQIMSNGTVVHRTPQPHYRPAFEFVSAQFHEELYTYMTL